MKLTLVSLLVGGLVLGSGMVEAQGPGATLLLRVNRKDNSTTTSNYRGSYGYSSKSGVETLSYHVEVINSGLEAVNHIRIKWAVVLKDMSTGRLRLVEGEKTTSLTRGQKFVFETDLIELGQFYRSTYGSSRSQRAEPVGYLVEAFVDGKPASADFKPADMRQKVDEARNQPKVHRF